MIVTRSDLRTLFAGGPATYGIANGTWLVTTLPNENRRLFARYSAASTEPYDSMTGCTWSESAKTLTKAGAFTNYRWQHLDQISITTPGGGGAAGSYAVASRDSDDQITLESSIGTDSSGVAGSLLVQEYQTDAYVPLRTLNGATLQWRFSLGAAGVTTTSLLVTETHVNDAANAAASTWTAASRTLGKVGGFADYTYRAGDYVQILAGAVTGPARVLAKTSGDAIVIDRIIAAANVDNNMEYVVVPTTTAQFHLWGAAADGSSPQELTYDAVAYSSGKLIVDDWPIAGPSVSTLPVGVAELVLTAQFGFESSPRLWRANYTLDAIHTPLTSTFSTTTFTAPSLALSPIVTRRLSRAAFINSTPDQVEKLYWSVRLGNVACKVNCRAASISLINQRPGA